MCSDNKPYAVVANRDALPRIEARNILEDAGYLVLEAAGVDEAKTLLDLHGIMVELLFIDHRIPPENLTGFDLISYSTQELPHIEVLVTSTANKARPDYIADEVMFTEGPLTASLVKELLPKAASKS
ncbi:DNA-binding NtrC family response regulator [Rhizobium soli]|uniref:DNA-binding NtrC family response regulator n=1 Tax=Rhizobium soli TaxID=424798 RepID=A0A7X0JMV0_9HYPH|nr:response regulator [Rhizobium soli]MBB6510488.1 DNA-binding NtrC family response regulator [Rhizobium soli]